MNQQVSTIPTYDFCQLQHHDEFQQAVQFLAMKIAETKEPVKFSMSGSYVTMVAFREFVDICTAYLTSDEFTSLISFVNYDNKTRNNILAEMKNYDYDKLHEINTRPNGF